MTDIDPRTLTFEQFRALIAEELALPQDRIKPDALFIEDLLVDSIRMVEMMLKLEEEGLSIPLEAAWSIETVKDAFEQYQKYAQEGSPGSSRATATAGGE